MFAWKNSLYKPIKSEYNDCWKGTFTWACPRGWSPRSPPAWPPRSWRTSWWSGRTPTPVEALERFRKEALARGLQVSITLDQETCRNLNSFANEEREHARHTIARLEDLLTALGPALGGALGTDAQVTVSVPKVTWITIAFVLGNALQEMEADIAAGQVGGSAWSARLNALRCLRNAIEGGINAAVPPAGNPPDPGQ
jgi:hypothetical protein